MTTTITIPQEAIEELAHKIAMEVKNEQNKDRCKAVVDPYSFEELQRKVSEIKAYCGQRSNCEDCYFYYGTDKGYCKCVLDEEPDEWDISRMNKYYQ